MTAPEDLDGVRRGRMYGFDALIVETAHSTAAISIFGGQVLSFRAPADAADALWVSPSAAPPPTPIRGGIPVCWPYFAREGQPADMPSHGYARTAQWQPVTGKITDTGDTEIELVPVGLDHLALRPRMTVRVGAVLEQGVHTHNPGTDPVVLTEALHNYFRVSDVAAVRVEGLDGLTYLDKFDELRPHPQRGDWALPDDLPRSDRVYPDAGGTYRVVDPGLGRVIEISGRGARTAVVWNPGEQGASSMADVGPHWREFLCVETANVGPNVVEVAGGATHSMWQTISVSALE
ncbi:D-hexose-6-phosphate mutarotase [Gordonia sp. CPCC 206044]|uniref:D-hexose-6-phosphate mutarotase n=1 Tax=Gordonia sp. CPCC 206044 TaxID=3140793 RepID=UPI003AF3F816